ncbi:glycine cleavage system protein H [Desulfuribacillus stibiiarsenatis]|uniref:Glycine cleavage system H protein n=1 Tax=Desulfuribacillus stibiiarsenatis TaxID=1390249 RepID=A0A1E5L6M3_9FIRM|nr:glycine cleavage system protein GcvH [Desulfuribacillus stibiiarsenatis]OEH85633.1 glycine cleavage system protein H [Desulfuribacillus stibiiarsenatis]
MSEVKVGLTYSKQHEWVLQMEGNIVKIGISDYAQNSLGDIVFVELPEVGRVVNAGETVGVVESVKAVSDIYIPLSGTILAVNQTLEDQPELLNESPYELGWICELEMSDVSELNSLLQAEEYQELTKEEV